MDEIEIVDAGTEDEQYGERLAGIRKRQTARRKLFDGNRPFDLQTVIRDVDNLLSLLAVQPARCNCPAPGVGKEYRCDDEKGTAFPSHCHCICHKNPVQLAKSNREILSEMPDSKCAHSDWCNRWVGSKPRSYHPEIPCSCGAAVQPAASTPTTDKDELHFEVLFPRGVDRAIIEKSVRALFKNAKEIEVRIDSHAQSAFDAAASTETQDERKHDE